MCEFALTELGLLKFCNHCCRVHALRLSVGCALMPLPSGLMARPGLLSQNVRHCICNQRLLLHVQNLSVVIFYSFAASRSFSFVAEAWHVAVASEPQRQVGCINLSLGKSKPEDICLKQIKIQFVLTTGWFS